MARLEGTIGCCQADGNFSPVLIASSETWAAGTLDQFLINPAEKFPADRMAFACLTDAAEREAVIEYLKSLN